MGSYERNFVKIAGYNGETLLSRAMPWEVAPTHVGIDPVETTRRVLNPHLWNG